MYFEPNFILFFFKIPYSLEDVAQQLKQSITQTLLFQQSEKLAVDLWRYCPLCFPDGLCDPPTTTMATDHYTSWTTPV